MTPRDALAAALHAAQLGEVLFPANAPHDPATDVFVHGMDADAILAALTEAGYTLLSTAEYDRLLAAGDALNLAGGSRNAGEAGPERDERNRRVWYEASSEWVSAKAALTPSEDAS